MRFRTIYHINGQMLYEIRGIGGFRGDLTHQIIIEHALHRVSQRHRRGLISSEVERNLTADSYLAADSYEVHCRWQFYTLEALDFYADHRGWFSFQIEEDYYNRNIREFVPLSYQGFPNVRPGFSDQVELPRITKTTKVKPRKVLKPE